MSTVAWDGAAGDDGDPGVGDGHSFFDPWNWDADRVPGEGDVAVIPAGEQPVDFLGDAALAALQCQRDFHLQGGALAVADSSLVGGELLLAGGVLSAAQSLAVPGPFTWTGGKLTGSGRVDLDAGGTIDGADPKALDGILLDNRGLLVWSGSGPIRAAGGAILRNEPGAEWQLRSDASFDYESGPPPTLDNAGLLHKTAGIGVSALGAALLNSGVVQVDAGQLALAGGGQCTGPIQIAAAASVYVSGGVLQLDAGSQVAGDGQLVVGADGSLAVPAGSDVPVDSLALAPGTGGLGGEGTLTVVRAMHWTGGRMDGTGTTTIAPGATLEISGPAAKYLDRRTLVNRGQATWLGGGPVNAANAALIDNRDNPVVTPGLWTIAGDAVLVHTAGPQPVFRNSGQLAVVPGAQLTGFAFLENLAVGTVYLEGPLALHGGGSSAGPFEITAGGALRVAGESFTLSAGASQSGPGPIAVGGAGTLNVPAGASVVVASLTLNPGSGGIDGAGTLAIAGAMNWTGGRMAGAGATEIAPGATLDISGPATKSLDGRSLTNRGRVLCSGAGAIDVAGAKIANLANPAAPHGTWEFAASAALNQAGGPLPSFQNAGVVRVAGSETSATLGIPLTNSGQVLVEREAALATNAPFTQSAGATLVDGVLVPIEGLVVHGGLIAGSGTIGGRLANAGQLAIGASPGRLTVGGPLLQGPTASLAIELGGLAAGAEYDQLVVGGPVTLGGMLSVSRTFAPAAGETFVILENQSSDPIAGEFSGLPEGKSFVVAGQPFAVSYRGGTGNDVVLVAQPPPGDGLVTNTLDAGPGSVRQAILDANAAAGTNTITFAIPGASSHIISLASPLPALAEVVTLDVPAGETIDVGGASAFGFPDFAALVKAGAGTIRFGGGDVRIAGASLSIDAGTLKFRDGAAGLLAVDSLVISPAATLDLADSDLVVHAAAGTRQAVLNAVTSLIATGAANLAWNGPGINSSAAAADPNLLTALGVMLNDDGLGGAYHASFSGAPAGPNDVLVKYTYYGDADLSGSVDGTDYALVDNGFNASLLGWFNGDSDYSHTIDGTDYALIDNAFNSQGSPLAGSEPAGVGPIPRAATSPLPLRERERVRVPNVAVLSTPESETGIAPETLTPALSLTGRGGDARSEGDCPNFAQQNGTVPVGISWDWPILDGATLDELALGVLRRRR